MATLVGSEVGKGSEESRVPILGLHLKGLTWGLVHRHTVMTGSGSLYRCIAFNSMDAVTGTQV